MPAEERRQVLIPAEPPAELESPMRGDTEEQQTLGDILFDLCREDDYRGIYRLFVTRYGKSAR